MNTSSAPPIKRRTAIIGWITLFTQAALPLSLAYAPLVHAATAQDASAPKWYQSGNNASQDDTMFGQSTDTLNGAGAALSQANSAAAAAGMARSAATGAVNNGVEEWLSQFGTARVQLNLDDNFKAEGSQADLLLPLYENKSIIAFTQLGFRHIDSRNTGNLGVGARYFTGDWMLGANTFFDNDFTGENRRIGLGLEAWRDYLKLSVNSYIRLSKWHQSRDFADYDERPANGYDLRAEGWLPAFPQLGAKVMYEKYEGDEVALFGKDNRQKDPWAFTGGITYTPVPLVTVGAQHRAGKDGQNDSQLLLEMNYRLGEPWDKQIAPDLVGASRTLSGTRYDLVERNNSIVLDYRKQQTVTLVVPEKTSGKGGSTVPVSFTVKSQNPLQRIDWDAAALVAAGGSLTQISNSQLSVVLPAYQTGSNVYRFAGIAYDVNGNSGSATGQITVEVGDVSATATQVSAEPATIIADGKSTSTVSISLFDAGGNAIPGMAKSLSATLKETLAANQPASLKGPQAATLGAITEAMPGVYQAVVTSGTGVGSILVSPTFNDTALAEVTVTETADNATGQIGSGAFTAVVDNSAANGTAMNQVKATVTDAGGNPLANTAVTFALSGSATAAAGSSLSATTDDKGQVSLNFVDKIAEAVTVTATLPNGNSGTVDTHFLADGSTATLSDGAVTVDKTTVVANNTDMATFSAVVKDANGNVVPDVTVSWATDKGTLSGASSTTNADGVATITLKNNVAEAAQVSAKAGTSASVNAPVVTFTADNASATIGSGDLTVDKTTVIANNADIATFSAIVKDAGGNLVANQTVNWTTNKGTLSGASSTTDANGLATITLKDTVVGQAQVVAQTGTSASINAPAVDFIADTTTATISSGDLTVDKTTVVANNADVAIFSAKVKDAHGNAVPNATVKWTTNKGALSGSTSTTDANGVATITLKDKLVGQAQVAAQTGTSGNVNAPVVTFVANATTATIGSGDLTVDKTTVVADNLDAATFSAVVKDDDGNLVPNVTVNWSTDKGSLSGATSTTNASGIATITLKNTLAEKAQVVAQTGTSSGVNAPQVEFIANSSTGAIGSGDLTVDKVSVIANNADIATYTAVVKDANGNLVHNIKVSWTTDFGTLSAAESGTGDTGSATITLKGTVVGLAQVTASVNGAAPTNANKVTFIADTATATIGSGDLTVDKTTLIANNADEATYSAIVKDANGNLVPNEAVSWTTNKGTLSGASSSTDASGVATIKLKGTVAGDAQVVAKVGTSANVNAPVVKFMGDSGNLSTAKSTLTAAPATIVANGKTASTVTLSLKDVNDNAISGQTVTFSSSLGSVSSVKDNGDGTYSASLTGITAGTATITASVGGNTFGVAAATLTLTADSSNLSTAKSTLIASPTSIVADGTTPSTITLSLKDANNNPVSGQSVTFKTTLSGSVVGSVTDKGDGTYNAELTGTKAGNESVTVSIGGKAFSVAAAAVTLNANVLTATITSLSVDKTSLPANNTDLATYTAIVKDAHDNPVSGQTIVWAGNPASTTLSSSSPTDSAGRSTVTLKGTREQTAVINATLNGGTPVKAQIVSFLMPEIRLTGDRDAITAGQITSVLATTEAAFVNLYDGHHAPTIAFPAASGLNGKTVKIINTARDDTRLTINGGTFTLDKNTTYLYTSNGSSWVRQ
ncbi:Ig-like domain-containing protein [Pantoea agglomerans]